jgi:hypothetical protein
MTSRDKFGCLFGFASLLIPAAVGQDQRQEYEADAPKTILQLQQFRQASSIHVKSRSGRQGTATLVDLNPAINAWYLLTLQWNDSRETTYHLENANPRDAKLVLDQKDPSGLLILEANHRDSCDPFDALAQGQAAALVFYPLCDGRIYLRNPAAGHSTTLEEATEFLREHVWGGEKIIALGHILMGDAHLETGKVETEPGAGVSAQQGDSVPLAAAIDPRFRDRLLASGNLGIDLGGPARTGLTPGAWYAARANPGVYVSILQPNLVNPPILTSYQAFVNNLDNVEAAALCYLVAFDLDRFELGYARGTEHPKVGWSDHILERMKDPKLPGPDGIATISPLIATGLVSPEDAGKTVATFIGGFKREQGAFKYGDLALRNHGSHYGFIENGVVFSKLQPGLATVYVLEDGSLGMKTWTDADDQLLKRVRHARQNGVPVIEFDPACKTGVPGPLVNRWGAGNWSGSENMKLRTMRSGLALAQNHGQRFLIYAVFSDATPSAMARIFQAYRCDYAMLLDMNALEHTYLALYRRSGSQLFVDHLVKGMSVLEKSASGEIVPRFLGYADNRDFFYMVRTERKQ